MDNLKSQLLTISAMKGDNIKEIAYSLLYIILIEQLIVWLPMIVSFIKEIVNNYIKEKANQIIKVSNISKEIRSNILIKRNYELSHTDDSVSDSVIDFITSVDNIKFLQYVRGYYPNSDQFFEINPEITCKILDVVKDNTGIKLISLQLISYEMDLTQLKNFISDIYNNYTINKQNKLGNKLCYFNEIIQPISPNTDGSLNYVASNKNMKFTSTFFYTNKSLNNIYGDQIELVNERLNFFLNNKKWYSEKGIPHTFGLLLHGDPGCGKTSMIKAIAKTTNRHIINLSIHSFLTRAQLNNLFYGDKLHIENIDKNIPDIYTIPNDKRIYVIEDIDAMSNIVLQRENTSKKTVLEDSFINQQHPVTVLEEPFINKHYNPPPLNQGLVEYKIHRNKVESDEVSLSYLLNVLDGVLEVPGRILIITSNFPEKLDKALIRPGRIDLCIKFKKCSKQILNQMVNNFYDKNIDLEGVLEDYWTPAEATQIFLENLKNPDFAIKKLSNQK